MLKTIIRLFFISAIFFSVNLIFSQEFNYWANQVGAQSSMLGGAVTAGGNDNSAIYYNPGALGFNNNTSLSLSSDSYYVSWLNIENGAGDNMDLVSNEVNVFPQIISFNQKVPKLPITLTLAGINHDNSFTNMSYRNEMEADVLKKLPGKELYIGTIQYYSRIRENWVGFGYGRKFNQYLSFGFSTFITVRAMEYRYSKTADVYRFISDSNDISLAANTAFSDYVDYRNIGMIFMVGASYQREKIKFGINVTLPRINLRFIGRSNLRREFEHYVPSVDSVVSKFSIWQQSVKSTFKSPLSIDFGVSANVSLNTTLYAKVSWFAKVGSYPMLDPDNSESLISYNINKLDPEFNSIYLANRSLINAAIAFKTRVSEEVQLLGSLRTDFNYFDRSAFDLNDDFIYGITYWDIYHIAGGLVWTKEKFELSLGTSYSFGRDNSLPQVVNLSDPTSENNLFGVPKYNSTARFNQVSLFLGFTYFFNRSLSKEDIFN